MVLAAACSSFSKMPCSNLMTVNMIEAPVIKKKKGGEHVYCGLAPCEGELLLIFLFNGD